MGKVGEKSRSGKRTTGAAPSTLSAPAVVPSITLRKFGATWCQPCKMMEKAKLLDKFKAAHPEVAILTYDIDKAADNKLSDELDVQSVPAFVFVDSISGKVYAGDAGMMALADLEKLYAKAKEIATSGGEAYRPDNEEGEEEWEDEEDDDEEEEDGDSDDESEEDDEDDE